VVRYTPTHFQVLATDGDVYLGGVDWNDRLLDYVAEQFKARHGIDPRESSSTAQILRNDCDLAKVDLTTKEIVSIVCRHEGKSISVPVTREQFEEMTADLIQRTIDTTELVIEQAKIKPNELDAIVLVGGSTLMPKVPQYLEQVTGMKPYQGLSPHTAVAQGAAIHAAILEARFRGKGSDLADRVRKHLASVQQDDVNSHGLGIAVRNPRTNRLINHIMIPRNSRLPVETSQTFTTNEPNQQRVTIKVIEGDAPDPDACSLIGNCRITELPPNLPKGAPVEVTYAFGTDGRVKVRARDKTGGSEAAIEIQRRGGLDDGQIDAYANLATKYKVE
jgi:molecular chaperone DnaK